jgi:hypothetical protein
MNVDMCVFMQRHVLLEALRYVTHAAAGPSGTALPMRTEEESIDSIAIVKAFDVFALLRSLQSLVDAGASDPTVGCYVLCEFQTNRIPIKVIVDCITCHSVKEYYLTSL